MLILTLMITVVLLTALIMFKDYLRYGFVKAIYWKQTGRKSYYLQRLYKIKKKTPLLTYRARIRHMRRYILSNKKDKRVG